MAASPHSPPAAILAAAASLPLPPSKQGKREGSGGTGRTGRQTNERKDRRTDGDGCRGGAHVAGAEAPARPESRLRRGEAQRGAAR